MHPYVHEKRKKNVLNNAVHFGLLLLEVAGIKVLYSVSKQFLPTTLCMTHPHMSDVLLLAGRTDGQICLKLRMVGTKI